MATKINTFYKMLNTMNDKDYIETFISYNVALISATLKPSITLNLVKGGTKNLFILWNSYGENYLEKLHLNYIKLRETENSLIILIYNKELLLKYLNFQENKLFLNRIGYASPINIKNALETLTLRYELYSCPHELGIFLGYPLNDVKAFMKCSKDKCLLCGYWKVYNKADEAQSIFKLFDTVKNSAVNNIINGIKAENLSNILKCKFEENHKILFRV